MPGERALVTGSPQEEMLRMSFMEHLAELRSRLLKALAGVGVAFVFSILFTNQLWHLVSQPVDAALRELGLHQNLVFTAPMEAFNTVWVKLPMLAAIFLASPWVLYQVWAFIAPGLYQNERRWAAPFVLSTAGLFVAGGLFSYFVAFRYGLTFLLGVGRDLNIQPMVAVSEYFDLFINVTLGIGVVFELPVLLFLLTLLHIVSPAFLLRNSRYAILVLTIIAAADHTHAGRREPDAAPGPDVRAVFYGRPGQLCLSLAPRTPQVSVEEVCRLGDVVRGSGCRASRSCCWPATASTCRERGRS